MAVDLCEGARLRLAVTVLGRLAGSNVGLVHCRASCVLPLALLRGFRRGSLWPYFFSDYIFSVIEDAAAQSFLQDLQHAKEKEYGNYVLQNKFMISITAMSRLAVTSQILH